MLNEFWAKRDLAAKTGVKILSAYVAATEHTYYITVRRRDRMDRPGLGRSQREDPG